MNLAVIRIHGQVGLRKEIVETLNRLRLKKKYSCVVLEGDKEELGMIKKVNDFVAYGEINDTIHKKLNEKRKSKIKNFYRLHPARGGIDAKKHFGETNKAVLGNNGEKINNLIERML